MGKKRNISSDIDSNNIYKNLCKLKASNGNKECLALMEVSNACFILNRHTLTL